MPTLQLSNDQILTIITGLVARKKELVKLIDNLSVGVDKDLNMANRHKMEWYDLDVLHTKLHDIWLSN